MRQKSCLVWSPLNAAEGGTVEYPALIADAIDAPVYTHSCTSQLRQDGYDGVEFRQFSRKSIFDQILSRTPLADVGQLLEYAMCKPPAKYDVFVTRGPKAIHTTQRIGQRHIHVFDGSYRGPFLHKDQYDKFHTSNAIGQFLFGGLRLVLRTAIQSSINTIDTIVVNSEWTANLIESLYDRKPDAIIYPLMQTDSYSPDYRNETINDYYLYLGEIDPHHRTETVIRAFNQLPYRLKIAGEGRQRDELETIADNSIEFCGYVTGREKREMLASAKALVNPTDHSFGRVLVESLASGRPVISTQKGHPGHLLEDGVTGVLYEGSTEELINAVERFESDGISATTDELVQATSPFARQKNATKWKQVVNENINSTMVNI
jgi:glycosyltransferase involved in cell wall biosynthesis